MSQLERTHNWRERGDRRLVNVSAVAYLSDGSAISVHLTNISYEGCQVELEEMLPIGEKLKLALPRLGEISAQVRWSLPGRAGLHFLLEEGIAGERRSRSPD